VLKFIFKGARSQAMLSAVRREKKKKGKKKNTIQKRTKKKKEVVFLRGERGGKRSGK